MKPFGLSLLLLVAIAGLGACAGGTTAADSGVPDSGPPADAGARSDAGSTADAGAGTDGGADAGSCKGANAICLTDQECCSTICNMPSYQCQ